MTPYEAARIREQAGLSQAELARLCGYLKPHQIGKVENGQAECDPKLARILRMIEAGHLAALRAADQWERTGRPDPLPLPPPTGDVCATIVGSRRSIGTVRGYLAQDQDGPPRSRTVHLDVAATMTPVDILDNRLTLTAKRDSDRGDWTGTVIPTLVEQRGALVRVVGTLSGRPRSLTG